MTRPTSTASSRSPSRADGPSRSDAARRTPITVCRMSPLCGDGSPRWDRALPAEREIAMPRNLDLALIGNGAIGLLIDSVGAVVWGCFPRFDSDATFCALL